MISIRWLAVRRAVALAVGLVALVLVGVWRPPADAQKRGGTLTIVRPTDPVSLDPHLETTAPGAWVYNNILEPLVIFELRSGPLKHNLYTGSWLTVNVDADATLFARYHSKQIPPVGWNNFRYANPRVDALVEQGRRSVNQAERERLYGEAQDVIAMEIPQIPIYNTRETVVTRAYVKGYVIHPIEYNLGLSQVWLDK